MKVLVTGANGFVGRWLVRRLLAEGHDVTAAAGPGGSPAGPDLDEASQTVRWLALDLGDADSVRAAAAGVYEAVIHLAAVASTEVAAGDPGAAWAVNTTGTARLLGELARVKQVGSADPVVLIVSSGEVYGRGPCRPRRETDPTEPVTPYAASKLGAEIAALESWRRAGLRVVIARPFAHTGPDQAPRYVVPAFARRLAVARQSGTVDVKVGNLEPVREFLHVRDVVDAYVRLLSRGVPGEVYNVASGHGISLEGLFVMMAGLLGVHATAEPDPDLVRSQDVPHLIGDAAKLRQATEWEPRTSLEDTLREVLDAQAV